LRIKGSGSAFTGAARIRDSKPSRPSGRQDGSHRVEVKSDRRITYHTNSQAYRSESQSSASSGPALVVTSKPDEKWGSRHDSTSKARVLAPTVHAVNRVQHVSRSADRHSMGHVDAVADPLERAMPGRPWQNNTLHLFSQSVVTGQ
jgi:hypothetical protein